MSGQVECSLHYDGQGLVCDTVRLVGIESSEWQALRAEIPELEALVPRAAQLVLSELPQSLSRSELLELADEFGEGRGIEQLSAGACGAFMTLSLFVAQARDQREAGILVEFDPEACDEAQTFLQPGVDILSDLEAINSESRA